MQRVRHEEQHERQFFEEEILAVATNQSSSGQLDCFNTDGL
ncbi:MAG: hypothetical protein U0T81_13025 [Saprospiraceae bacterium]